MIENCVNDFFNMLHFCHFLSENEGRYTYEETFEDEDNEEDESLYLKGSVKLTAKDHILEIAQLNVEAKGDIDSVIAFGEKLQRESNDLKDSGIKINLERKDDEVELQVIVDHKQMSEYISKEENEYVKCFEIGEKSSARQIAKKLLSIFTAPKVAELTGLSVEEVNSLKEN